METKHTATDPKRENSTAPKEECNTTPEEQQARTVMTEEELGNVAGGLQPGLYDTISVKQKN